MVVSLTEIMGILIILLPKLPEEMVTHWDFYGQAIAGATASKEFIINLCIYGIVVILLSFIVISRFQHFTPEEKNTQFYYGISLNIILQIYFILFLCVMVWNLEIKFNFLKVYIICLHVFILVIGWILYHSKSHWFVAFNTFWTKQSEDIFDKTNRFLGFWLCFIGAVGVFASFITIYAIYSIAFVFLAILFSVCYSYILYRAR